MIREESNNLVYERFTIRYCEQLSLDDFTNNSDNLREDEPIMFDDFLMTRLIITFLKMVIVDEFFRKKFIPSQ